MAKTSSEIRARIRVLGLRIMELQSAGAKRHPALAAALADLQAEQAGLKLMLVTRKLQLQDKVVELARWRDGFAPAAPSMEDHPRPVRAEPGGLRKLRIE